MIPDQSGISIQSNIDGEKIKLGIEDENLGFILGMLTKAYKDPEEAALREPATNARDAHKAAGVDLPIEIFLPSHLSPFYRCKDRGTGMSLEDLRHYFTKYGSSTKRDSNEFNGVWGIGCKAPLAYTNQFTLITVKDGMKIEAIMSMDDTGSAHMQIANEAQTDEGNGTEIIVPVKRDNKFGEIAERLFRFWPKGSVLVNGRGPARPEQFLELSDKMKLVKRPQGNNAHASYVVMAGVPYEIPAIYSPVSGYNRNYYFVAEIENGEVSFTPSRDALELNTKTKARLEGLKAEFEAEVNKAIAREIAGKATHHEAFAARSEWSTAIGKSIEPLYKGVPVPHVLDFPSIAAKAEYRAGSHKAERIDTRTALTCLVVTGYTQKWNSAHKAKLMHYQSSLDIEVGWFVLCDKLPADAKWIDPKRIVSWSVIKEVKLERAEGTTLEKALSGTFEVFDGTSSYRPAMMPASDIQLASNVYFWTLDMFELTDRWRHGKVEGPELYGLLCELGLSGIIVKLPLNRKDKFLRDFPGAKDIKVAMNAAIDSLHKSLPKDVIKAWALRENGTINMLQKMDPKDFTDPKLKEAIKLSKVVLNLPTVKTLEHLQRHRKAASKLAHPRIQGAYAFEPAAVYPLIPWGQPYHGVPEHAAVYCNAVYAAKNAKD